ncbi:MAG TPA: histidine kinase [Candidatus Angelobacter sp.]|nr:histidine kinase [Candidatus Angelobacter sp.]
MNIKPPAADQPAQLRRRAEDRLRERPGNQRSTAAVPKSDADTKRLLHELQVHQIELEMQNAELRQARDELELALDNYTDLYDFAPSGYFTFAPTGAILQANLTGATLVGIERSRLVGQSFGRLISAGFRPAFSTFLEQVFAGQTKQAGDFELACKGQPLRFVNIEAQCLLNGLECRATVVDITARKAAEAARSRLEVVTASNRMLEQEIIRRKALEQALKASEQQLRRLSHEILLAQEKERKRISRELHDTVLQTLVGISAHLATLTPKLADNPQSLQRKIKETQRLVEKSLAMVHRFAVELRPTVLDDLGLIPALHTFMKDFMKRTGVRARLTVYAAVNQLPLDQSAVLYRVALEALNNVGFHAQASAAEVQIKKLPDWVCLTIKDNGKSFDVKSALRAKGSGHLGLLGMKERLQMVGGKFSIKSTPGRGTTVTARIPATTKRVEKHGKRSFATKP